MELKGERVAFLIYLLKRKGFCKGAHGSGPTRLGSDMEMGRAHILFIWTWWPRAGIRVRLKYRNNYKGRSSNGGTQTHALSQKVI